MRTVDSSLLTPKILKQSKSDGLRWGILASGGIASLFARELLAAGMNVEAVASRTLMKAKEFQRKFGTGKYGSETGSIIAGPQINGGGYINKAYGSYQELIDDPEIDVIYIATPHSDHMEWALKCLDGDKPVLIEKAIARNSNETKAIFNKAKECNLFAMEAIWTRFLPHIIAIQKIIAEGKIGEIVSVNADFAIRPGYLESHRLFNPDLAGGALLDLGIYPIQLVHQILGKPQGIIASGFASPTGVDANLSCIMNYENGAQANIYTSTLTYSPTIASINGTKGRIDINAPFYRPSDFKVKLFDTNEEYLYKGLREQVELFGDDGKYGMHFEALEVEECIKSQKLESSVVSHKDSLEIMGIMDEIRNQLDFKYPGE